MTLAAVSLDGAVFVYRFAEVFNGYTFHDFLKQVVARFAPRKIFLIIDNAPWHNLKPKGKVWLKENLRAVR